MIKFAFVCILCLLVIGSLQAKSCLRTAVGTEVCL